MKNPVAKAVTRIVPKVIPDKRDRAANKRKREAMSTKAAFQKHLQDVLEPFVKEALEWRSLIPGQPVLTGAPREDIYLSEYNQTDLANLITFARTYFDDDFLARHKLTRFLEEDENA